MQRLSRISIILASLLIAACASSPPKPVVDFDPQHDFSDERKIAFYALSGQSSGENPVNLADFQKERLNTALRTALSEKGFTMVDSAADADLLISWHLISAEKTDVKTYNSPNYGMSMGYSRYNRYAMYNCYSCFDNTEVRVSNYTEGTFIVDMIEPEKQRSVWRAVTQSKLKGENINDQEVLNNAARVILNNFPPMTGE
ncbi:conserved hypothetical protein [Luminiphilus syltensis NOR5-1B]|uniref:DUF4136 domain-containing protein n=1 Tax=Luminiphilus syltensis NOR5-1B TaxID=565045 RepID=B8KSW4_9GAMM|nr:DUF4136 domain-containing protein [Luminiphilus syltensis]EED34753.1 conserved hypothetical protein [Luminiphilus syltensis NOR5-1B]